MSTSPRKLPLFGSRKTELCVGVLCIDVAVALSRHYGPDCHSFIAASYVKYLESAGAQVVPIWIGRERSYYESIMQQINGVLLPGGAVFIDVADVRANPHLRNDCVESVRHIYELAVEKNKNGDYFPLWGTCLGYQLILINAAKSGAVRSDCCPMSCALPLGLAADYRESVLLHDIPQLLAEKMVSVHFACHQHRFCITESDMQRYGLTDWHVLATQIDKNGICFVTLLEHRQYPFFGCQFHPERVAYEQFARTENYSHAHARECIEIAQFFANSFVDACRRNTNSFETWEQKQRHLIWNWQPVFTGILEESNWLQCYLFDRDVDYPPSVNDKSVK